jgi:Zn-dependent metalloprotease
MALEGLGASRLTLRRMWGRCGRTSLWRAARVVLAVLLVPAGASAVARRDLAPPSRSGAPPVARASIGVRPLASAPRVVPEALPASSQDPRHLAVGAALRARGAEVAQRARASLADDLRLRAAAGAATASAVRGDVEVRRGRAGTPRWIAGARLERAGPGPAGRARDEATARAWLRRERALVGLRDPDRELALTKSWRDELGHRHLGFEQRHRGLRVWPAELRVHLDPRGDAELVNGAWIPTPVGVGTEPSWSAADAAARARAHVGAGPSTGTQAELLVYAPGDGPARLAWSVFVPASLREQWRVVVDARSGEVCAAWNTVMEVDVAGSGIDLFGELQPLRVWQEGPFHLVDTSKPMFDPSSDPPGPATTRGGITILDAVNQPPTPDPQSFPPLFQVVAPAPNGPWLADGVSAASHFARVYDYFLLVHGRNSIDGAGGSLLGVVRLGLGYANAFYLSEGNLVAFGDAVPFAGALDVVAHELAHGVTHHTANLVYRNESGALNEAFSDIFGEMVEAWVRGAPDWLVGSPPAFAVPIRSLEDPGSLLVPGLGIPYPDRYGAYVRTSFDNGGVHINSSIVNHAFYLLAEGLPGALGREAAERIFFRALTVYLTASAAFVDARLASVRAAGDLFGAGSVEAVRTAEAFDAVEVFEGPGTGDPPGFPGSQGQDSTLFVRHEGSVDADFLYRREPPLDGTQGSPLSFFDVRRTRPAVVGDGSFAVFVDSIDDICFILTDGTLEEDCLGFAGQIASVSVSPDGNLYGFVLLVGGIPENVLTVVDLTKPPGQGDVVDYELRAPALDGGRVATVRYADAIDFTGDGSFVVYDALNRLDLAGGGAVEVWSIYAIERATGATFAVIPPAPGVSVGYPALAQRSDNHLVFDVLDTANGASTVFTANLNTGETRAVGLNVGGYAVPGYTGDDRAVVFSVATPTPTGYTLVAVPLGNDRVNPIDDAAPWLADADYGVVYRRGIFVPEPAAGAGAALGALALLALRRRRRVPRA